MGSAHKTLNLRLSQQAYDAVRALAESRSSSMNKVVEQEVLAAAERERKERLRAAFARVAQMTSAEQDVDFAFEAQQEVVLESE